jgi:STE24 endopeptidase
MPLLLVIALVMGIVISDSSDPAGPAPMASGLWLLSFILVPKIVLGFSYWVVAGGTFSRLGTAHAPSALRRLDWAGAGYWGVAILLYVSDLLLGARTYLTQQLGHVVLVRDLLIMAPTLALIGWLWWAYYPIDRRLRNATLMTRLDAGLPVQPIWTRGQYLLAQFRHNIAIFLAPILLMLAWDELVQLYGDRVPWPAAWIGSREPILHLVGPLTILLLSPLLIVHLIWDTLPLPEGPLRRRLVDLCRFHRVRVRELLLWRTYGGLTNACFMGLIPPVRFILLTDALLDLLPTPQVEAVMAHELAHVRKHHIFWLMVAGGAPLVLLLALWMAALAPLQSWALHQGLTDRLPETVRRLVENRDAPGYAAPLLAVVCWGFYFGWLSRRFERQADTFAVQHLTLRRAADKGLTGTEFIDADSAGVMIDALQSVADLNHLSTKRRAWWPLSPAWRHGSIAWRQDYLRALVGESVGRQKIDRLVLGIKVAAATALAAELFLVPYLTRHGIL